jgi:glycosyltransferase involved in cell wall biosynthesis
MKILWFTNILLPAISRHLGVPSIVGPGSWIESLRLALKEHTDIKLGICSNYEVPFNEFEKNGVHYFSILKHRSTTRFGRVAQRWPIKIQDKPPISKCLSIIESFSPDVIHIHGTENVFGHLSNTVETPVIISLQGLLTVYRRFYFFGLSFPEKLRLLYSFHFLKGSGEVHGYYRMVKKARREEAIIRSAKWLIGRTQWDRIIACSLNPKATYFHCDEIMRPEFFKQSWDPLFAKNDTLYCTSSSMLFKGAETLFEAMAILRSCGMKHLRLKISGIPEYGDVWNFCLKRVKKYGLEGSINFLGRVDEEEIVRNIRNAGIFIYPSHIDNSPNSLSEAMLIGAPIIAANVGGIPSLIRDGKEGLLYDDKDPYALAARIRQIIEDSALAQRLGRKARQTALSRHDPGAIASKMIDIYETVGKHGRKSI